MKSREISRSKIGPFSLACTNPYIGIGWGYQSRFFHAALAPKRRNVPKRRLAYATEIADF